MDIKFLLFEKNAWDIVSGTEKKPDEKTGDPKDIKDYNARSKLALSILYLNAEKEFHCIIEKLTDPAEIWCKLKHHFYPDNRAHHMMQCM